MNCPICDGPMGFGEATNLGNCLKCDDRPTMLREFAAMAVLLACAVAAGLLMGFLYGGAA